MPMPKTLLAIALLASGCAASAADKVYIANENADTVSVIDIKSRALVSTVRVCKGPNGVSVTP